jgi:hypothetical protein
MGLTVGIWIFERFSSGFHGKDLNFYWVRSYLEKKFWNQYKLKIPKDLIIKNKKMNFVCYL